MLQALGADGGRLLALRIVYQKEALACDWRMPSNSCCPVSSSCISMAKLYTSAAFVILPSISSSAGMYLQHDTHYTSNACATVLLIPRLTHWRCIATGRLHSLGNRQVTDQVLCT